MKKFRISILMCMFLCLTIFLPGREVKAHGTRLFNIVIKDGYTTQKIEMKYGETPYGYTSYYANRSVIYVNPKAKNVTFSIQKNTSSRYGNFSFASTTLKPDKNPKGNLFTYTVDGKTRAWMFTVQKLVEPKVKNVKLTYKKTDGTFFPKAKKYIRIQAAVETEIPVRTEIRILNAAGKTVFLKELGESGSKSYTYRWNGKPSKKNSAKLKTNAFVPAGEYRIRIIAIPQTGGKRQEFYKEQKIIVGEK